MVMGWNSDLIGRVALASEPRQSHENRTTDTPEEHTSVAPSEPSAPLAHELLEGWFRSYFARLWRLISRLGVPSENVDDVVQDTFIAASRRQADIREGREWPFLVGTALRVGANYRARKAARREVNSAELLEHEASALPDAEQLLSAKRLRQELEQALLALSKEHRSVFVLYEIEGFSAPEIAEMLGLPLGTVASRLRRARAQFSKVAARMQRDRLTCQEDR